MSKSYFSSVSRKKSDGPLNCQSEEASPSFSVQHVQQTAKDENMWNLYPSFVLGYLNSNDSSKAVSVGQWCNIIHPVEDSEMEKECSSRLVGSEHAILEQLQKQCPSSNIMEIFNRYCLLTGKDISCADCLVCSIPVLRVEGEVVVDYVSLPRREVCVHSLPWTQMYSPTEDKQVMGNASACSSLLEWLILWRKKSRAKNKENVFSICGESRKRLRVNKSNDEFSSDPDFLPSNYHYSKPQPPKLKKVDFPAAVMIYGPHGSGKTAAVYACAMQAGFKVSEVNTSSLRSKSQLLQKLKEATLSRRVQPFSGVSLLEKSNPSLCSNTIILFDEIDVVFCKDHGFLQAVQEMVSSTRCPVILTCSEPPLEFHGEVLQLKFCLPSEIELAVHLSLLSLTHNWPLPLQHSCQLCRYFQGDIRKAILHLQLMLSWEPSDPMLPLEGPLASKLNDSVADSAALSLDRTCPNSSRLIKSSHLDIVALRNDEKSEVDSIQESFQKEFIICQPWSIAVEPSLLDEHPIDSSSCSLGRDIVNTLHHLLHADSYFSNSHKRSNKMTADNDVIEKIFSKSWHLNRTAMATEAIPVLKLMHDHEEMQIKMGGSRIRQSRHYFHPHQLELDNSLSIRFHED